MGALHAPCKELRDMGSADKFLRHCMIHQKMGPPVTQFLPVAANIAWDGLRWQYIFAHWQPSGTDELSAAIPAAAAVVVSWLGAMP